MTRQAKYTSGYEITEEGNKRIITFRGDGLAPAAYIVLPILYIWLFTLFFTPFWIVPAVVIFGSLALFYPMFQGQSFALTSDTLIKQDVAYDLDKISEIILDNPLDKGFSVSAQPGMIVGGTGVLGASVAAASIGANLAGAAMVEASAAIERSAAKRRFRVRIRYGSKLITIARNLKQPKAASIFQLLTAE